MTPAIDGTDTTRGAGQPCWELLHAYRVTLYPSDLVVLTTASEEEFARCVDAWGKHCDACDGMSIGDTVRAAGFYAVEGCHTGKAWTL